MPERKIVPVVKVGVLDPYGGLARFHLVFYGIPYDDFMKTPLGGERIRAALERRGMDDYLSSPFMVEPARRPL